MGGSSTAESQTHVFHHNEDELRLRCVNSSSGSSSWSTPVCHQRNVRSSVNELDSVIATVCCSTSAREALLILLSKDIDLLLSALQVWTLHGLPNPVHHWDLSLRTATAECSSRRGPVASLVPRASKMRLSTPRGTSAVRNFANLRELVLRLGSSTLPAAGIPLSPAVGPPFLLSYHQPPILSTSAVAASRSKWPSRSRRCVFVFFLCGPHGTP